MSWMGNLFGSSASQLITSVAGVVDEFITTDEERADAKFKLQKLLQERDIALEQTVRTELQAKERIVIAELQQGDNYTKRARPTVVYFGLLIILFNYCIVPAVQQINGLQFASFDLPTEFWIAWGGIVSTWTIGRSAEKRGMKSKTVSVITGSKFDE